MLGSIVAVAALAVAFVAYFIDDLIRKRRQLDGLPQPPMPNKLLGHLPIADECSRIFPKNHHMHVWADYLRTKYDLPEAFYFDLRPFGPLWLYVANPVLTSQYVTTTQCLVKSSLEVSFLNRFLGPNNLVTLEGARWKALRSRFNPGFSAANIMTLTDFIVDASLTFCEVLREKAATNELFMLEEATTRLTIEIIGRAVLDADMPAQRSLHPIVKLFRERVVMMPPASAIIPWDALNPAWRIRLWWNGRKLDAAISRELQLKIQRRVKELEAEESGPGGRQAKKRTVLDLALGAYEQDMATSGDKTSGTARITDISQLPPSLKADIVDSVKTFVFAGHDTTSSVICWAFYLLHRHPEARQKLAAELDSVFPRASGATLADMIKQDPYRLNKLEYTTAVLKETMRLFPPASTLRSADASPPPVDKTMVDPATRQAYPMAGTHIWPVVHLLNRNTRFFPRPTEFIPERFLPHQTPFPEAELFSTESGRDAFRPFEKGPRNCIGQELAMLEGRVILALTARAGFDFVLEYPGEPADVRFAAPASVAAELDPETSEYGRAVRAGEKTPDRIEGHRVYQVLEGSAKPAGKCPGRVYVL